MELPEAKPPALRVISDGVKTSVFVGDVDISGIVSEVEWRHGSDSFELPKLVITFVMMSAGFEPSDPIK